MVAESRTTASTEPSPEICRFESLSSPWRGPSWPLPQPVAHKQSWLVGSTSDQGIIGGRGEVRHGIHAKRGQGRVVDQRLDAIDRRDGSDGNLRSPFPREVDRLTVAEVEDKVLGREVDGQADDSAPPK
jgi:hypothetical protein